jgi:hypothetical protein
METGDSTVSIDRLVRTLLVLGASREDLAKSLRARRVMVGEDNRSENDRFGRC